MQLKPMRRGAIHLYTNGQSPRERNPTGVAVIQDKDEPIRRIAASLDHDKRVAVIFEGPYILPFLNIPADEADRYISDGLVAFVQHFP